jgi:hypothetical protein
MTETPTNKVLHEKAVLQEYAQRRKRTLILTILALPCAIIGFIMAVIFESPLGREQSALFIVGGMVFAFILLGFALRTARCPSCDRMQVHKIAGGHWRLFTDSGTCRHCNIKLRP